MEAVLLAVQLIVAIAMVGVILMQRSEGGALGIGGGPTGMMSARGAADLLSKATKWLAILFLANSLALGWISLHRDDGTNAIDLADEAAPKEKQGLPELPTIPDGD